MHILLIDDDVNLCRVIAHQLRQNDFTVVTANSGKSGLEKFHNQEFEIVISDIQMPDMTGMEVLGKLRKNNDKVIVILITAYGSVENAIEACKLGANDYLTKPFGQEQLLFTIEKAVRLNRLEQENEELRTALTEKYTFENMVSRSAIMEKILKTAARIAKTSSTILILGESGTGKELLAKGIHYHSPRKNKPLITVNCPSIPSTLLESELFGHRKGAFTGAIQNRVGKFEQADGGTLFLDEIGDLKHEMQAKLLRALQEKIIEPVGADQPVEIDVRIIAATNKDLQKEMEAGNFREDLYYRLSVVPLTLPPLRDRKNEIPYLVDFITTRYADGKRIEIHPEILNAFQRYDWPGNIRELENIIERMVSLRDSSHLTIDDVPSYIRITKEGKSKAGFNFPEMDMSLPEMEKQVIQDTLVKTNGNRSKAARLLKIPRHVLLYRIQKYGL